jgi:hypothetical protein
MPKFAKVPTTDIHDLRELVNAAKVKLDATDAELVTQKSLAWFLL